MTKRVWLDAGHGGRDVGAVGNGMQEATVALEITLAVGKELKRHGILVEYSRATDVFVGLSERASRANKWGADRFVSIHLNAFSDGSSRGLETYAYTGSTSGIHFAKDVHGELMADKLYTVNRGVKTANFAVLRETAMDAILVEVGFITNLQDATIINSSKELMAKAIARGILKNLSIQYIPESKPVNKPVTSKHWVDPTVEALAKLGIVFTDKRYDEPATRAEVIQMLYNAIKALQ